MSALHSLVGMCVSVCFFFGGGVSVFFLLFYYFYFLFISISSGVTPSHHFCQHCTVLLAVQCLLIVTFLQWHLAPASHLCPAKTADKALLDIHQHHSMTRRSKNRCQGLAFRDLGRRGWHRARPGSQTHLGSDLATVLRPRSPSFIAQVSRTLMNQWGLPLTLSWEMSQRGGEGSPTFMLPVRASANFQGRGMQLYYLTLEI